VLLLRLLLLFFVVALPLSVVESASAAPPSTITPLDSWVYPALDKLSGLGLIQTTFQGTRPYTRNEVARQINEGLTRLTLIDSPQIGRELLFRLERDYCTELRALEHPERPASSYFVPLREFSAQYRYQEGRDVAIVGAGVVAAQFPLNVNNDGISYSEHNNAQLTFSADTRLGSFGLLSLRPQLLIVDNGRKKASTDVSLRNGRVATQLGAFEISLGRQSLWWGPGRHGALVLSNNAQPLDMLRITNPSPIRLPWFLKYLGRFKLDLFWSRLEAERVVPKPYFSGVRMALQPVDWFTLGASRGIMFGGEGRPGVGGADFLTIISGKNLSGGEDTSNSVAAVDFRLKFPFMWGVEFYGEAGGEDEAGGWLANSARLAGFYFPRIEPSGRLSLRLEYADLSHIDDNSPMWYRHGIYRSGYTYEGKLLGHHAGGGTNDYFAELVCFLPGESKVVLSYNYERRGSDRPIQEKHHQGVVEIGKTVGRFLSLSLDGRINKINNSGFVDGAGRTDWLVTVGGAIFF